MFDLEWKECECVGDSRLQVYVLNEALGHLKSLSFHLPTSFSCVSTGEPSREVHIYKSGQVLMSVVASQ